MTRPVSLGIVGAGRVGSVLGAALRAVGHPVTAVAGESEASRTRAALLLPQVPLDKPTAVSRSCDLLLLTVPDDMLPNVVSVLSASGAIREGNWKYYLSYDPTVPSQLFDLTRDPYEQSDLSAAQPAKAAEMTAAPG